MRSEYIICPYCEYKNSFGNYDINKENIKCLNCNNFFSCTKFTKIEYFTFKTDCLNNLSDHNFSSWGCVVENVKTRYCYTCGKKELIEK
jgi:hypothetical protein